MYNCLKKPNDLSIDTDHHAFIAFFLLRITTFLFLISPWIRNTDYYNYGKISLYNSVKLYQKLKRTKIGTDCSTKSGKYTLLNTKDDIEQKSQN